MYTPLVSLTMSTLVVPSSTEVLSVEDGAGYYLVKIILVHIHQKYK